ncbi:MAG: hypothetical protein E7Z87_00515 [Cyanobacteria bacterium SIG26]|nr:hypothetical protein [Cyanobacteria bacterium SIG26]
MKIAKIQYPYLTNYNTQKPQISQKGGELQKQTSPIANVKVPAGFTYGANIHFRAKEINNITDISRPNPNRSVNNITHELYMEMTDWTKKRHRLMYKNFHTNPCINHQELYRPDQARLPLQDPKVMDKFIETSKIYTKYKDQPIICLGRSPKWFLNTALWMKDGINDYKFVAFSERWYWPDKVEGVRRRASEAPTDKEIRAYRRYLKDVGADPITMVANMKKTGQKTVITDYINSGKGATSFLEVLADYADDLGILEEFSKSFEIVGIGSMKYMEELDPFAELISQPRVILPEKLWPYWRNIKQTYHDIDYNVFEDMLLNENVNECRSTYYPHRYWTAYRPDRLKTGIAIDPKTISKKLDELAEIEKKFGIDKTKNKLKYNKDDDTVKLYISSFSPAMGDYRNLMQFWILDNLAQRGLLKEKHTTKM